MHGAKDGSGAKTNFHPIGLQNGFRITVSQQHNELRGRVGIIALLKEIANYKCEF